MKRQTEHTLGQAIQEYLKAFKIDKRVKEAALINAWEEIVGKTVAKNTTRIEINNSILYLEVRSAIIRNEIMLVRTELVKRLNQKAGEMLVKEIQVR